MGTSGSKPIDDLFHGHYNEKIRNTLGDAGKAVAKSATRAVANIAGNVADTALKGVTAGMYDANEAKNLGGKTADYLNEKYAKGVKKLSKPRKRALRGKLLLLLKKLKIHTSDALNHAFSLYPQYKYLKHIIGRNPQEIKNFFEEGKNILYQPEQKLKKEDNKPIEIKENKEEKEIKDEEPEQKPKKKRGPKKKAEGEPKRENKKGGGRPKKIKAEEQEEIIMSTGGMLIDNSNDNALRYKTTMNPSWSKGNYKLQVIPEEKLKTCAKGTKKIRKPPSPAQLKARENFVKMVRARAKTKK